MPNDIEQYSKDDILAHIVESETLAESFDHNIKNNGHDLEEILSQRGEFQDTELKKIQALRDNLEKIKSKVQLLLDTTEKMISYVGTHAAFFSSLKTV
jgi:ElaB/YqjD/DUF883 family membrane-anchored ribosome-binding protein